MAYVTFVIQLIHYAVSAAALFVCDPVDLVVLLFKSLLQFYDYILTLHLEIKYIWLSPWTYTKVLFLLIRYMACATAVLLVMGDFYTGS
jgi:hypothetical protein